MTSRRTASALLIVAGLALVVTGCTANGAAPNYTFAPPLAQTATPIPSPTPAVVPSTSAAANPSPSASVGPPAISLSEWKVGITGTITAGKLDLAIANSGTVPHELLIFKSDRDPSAYPVDAAGDIKEEGAGVTLVSDGDNIDPAGTQTRSVDLVPGKYLFVCNIPGHFKNGMFQVVTVAPIPAPSGSAPAISLSEWKVGITGTITAGKLDLAIANSGTVPHELLIFKSDRDPSAYPVDAAGDIKEEGAGVTLVSDGDNIDPAGTQTRSVDLVPGKYLFVCNIPGHFKNGMFQVVTVAP